MATLRDIAVHFGLSESTVSRTLNGKGRASEETRRRVLDYAQEIGYRPNLRARTLRLQQTQALGVIVPDIANPWYAQLFKEVSAYARRAGYRATLFDADEDPAREDSYVAYLEMSEVDCLIVATSGGHAYASLSDDLLRRVVFVDNEPRGTAAQDAPSRPVRFIGSDNVSAADHLTRHLLERGHRRIATLTGPLVESSAMERLNGFRAAMDAAGAAVPDALVRETNFLYEDGLEKARSLLSEENRPEAVIAQNNVLAYAVLRAAREQGRRVPADVAVACFDHLDAFGFMAPEFTTMRQPLGRIAELAVASAVEIAEGGDGEPERTVLEADFVPGETA